MHTEQVKQKVKTIFSGNLYKNYSWFYEKFFVNMNAAAKEFFNKDVDLKFICVSEKGNILFAGEDYFVTKIRLTKEIDIMLRISKTAVQGLLDDILGKSDKTFSFEELTELEAKILTNFNDFIYKSFSDYLTSSEILKKQIKVIYNNCHLTFFVRTKTSALGKLIISMPINVLPEIPLKEPVYSFGIDNFPKTMVNVDLLVGTTRIPLSDIKHMEEGDIVVLEKSNINKMVISVNDRRKAFKLSPNPALIVSLDDDEDEHGGNIVDEVNINTDNMWDSIQVDISAEFEQVKIPLGDLRQISEGLVVDIGSVYDNKIDLKVENKIIASGELVIINDRYGVRVDKVHNTESEDAILPQESISTQTSHSDNDEFDEEDFDYSNFEIEDEDI